MPPNPQPYPFTANHTTHQGSAPVRRPTLPSNPAQHRLQPQSNNPYLSPMSTPPHQPYRNPFSPAMRASGSSISTGSSSSRNLSAAFASPHDPLLRNSETRFGGSPAPSVRSSLRAPPSLPSVSEKFNLSPDPSYFLTPSETEPDDYLHNPDPRRDRKNDQGGTIFTMRGLVNLGCLILLCIALVGLFAGYPMAIYFSKHPFAKLGGFNFGGVNSTGQVTEAAGKFSLIDKDTPADALRIRSFTDPRKEMQLVFSDEFEADNRTFWPGDDPFWEAVDLHYWGTNNLEWYSPNGVTTFGGSLRVTLSEKQTHDLNYEGGMLSTWNKFCFTGGMILTSVVLPGANNVLGLWPAIWTMGNLGRAGFGASLEGMWPYTYDSCDVGTLANQTLNGQPYLATIDGDRGEGGALSFLPGQKLSRCTCPGEDHPGPIHSEDGTYFGRSAPEIDIFEAQVDSRRLVGEVSMSGQWAPFNYHYEWFNTSDNLIIDDPTIAKQNGYTGGAFQQATSVVVETEPTGYERNGMAYQVYGFEYKPGFNDAYISWINAGKKAWTLMAPGMGADSRVEIGPRPIPQEPMYAIINLGMSHNFGRVDLEHLIFPTTMYVDWVRVYQPKDEINIGCDPPNFPTMDYIQRHLEAFTNPNLTTWEDDYQKPFPRNRLLQPGQRC